MKHFLFEWKKLGKQKVVWFTVALAFGAAISLYFLQYAIAEKMQTQNQLKEESALQQFEAWLAQGGERIRTIASGK